MNNLLTKFVIGCIYVMVLWKKMVESEECRIFNDAGLLTADCAGKKIVKVPQDLNPSINALDISDNNIGEILNENTFKRYSDLITLKMNTLRPTPDGGSIITHESNLFVPLKKLELLEMSGAKFTDGPEFVFPASLKKLIVSSLSLRNLDLNESSFLEVLDASTNFLKKFPSLHPEAPINYIDLKKNPLGDIKAEYLAPFCRLTYLGLQVSPGGSISHPAFYCQCKRLEEWMKMCHIEGYTPCYKSPFENPTCDLNFSSQSLTQRNICLNKLPLSPIWKLVFFALALSILCPCLYLASEVFQKFKHKRDEEAAERAAADSAEEAELEQSDLPDEESVAAEGEDDGEAEE